jgi:hypothetical protein
MSSKSGKTKESKKSSKTEETKKLSSKKEHKSFDYDEHKDEDGKLVKLSTKEFDTLVDYLIYKNQTLLRVTKDVYSGKNKEVGKTDITVHYAELNSELKKLKAFYKAKPEKKAKKSRKSGEQLTVPFYVSDNAHDWVTQTNMGNGLIHMLVHYIPTSSNPNRAAKEPVSTTQDTKVSVSAYLELANSKLKTKTNIEELEKLALMHSDEYAASDKVSENTWVMGNDGFVSQKDDNLKRIVEIYNAYADAFNAKFKVKSGEAGYKEEVSVEDASRMAIPQRAQLSEELNVGDLLDRKITIKNPFTKEQKQYKTTTMISNMYLSFLSIVKKANMLSPPGNGSFCQYDIFEKFFNGSDDDYEAGKSVGLFFEGENWTPTAKQLKKIEFPITETEKEKLKSYTTDINAFQLILKKSSEKTEKKREDLSERQKKSKKTMDTFEPEHLLSRVVPFIEKGSEESEMLGKYFGNNVAKPKLDNPYGINTTAGTSLGNLYKIPKSYVSDADFEALSKDLPALASEITHYFSKLTLAYDAFFADDKNAKKRITAAKKAKKDSSTLRVKKASVVSPIKKKTKPEPEVSESDEEDVDEDQEEEDDE